MERPMTTKNIGQPCVICGQAADAQATIAALQARAEQAERLVALQAQEILQRRQTLGDLAHLHQQQSKELTQRTAQLTQLDRTLADVYAQRDGLQKDLAQRTAELEAANKLLYRKNCELGRFETIISDLQAELERVKQELRDADEKADEYRKALHDVETERVLPLSIELERVSLLSSHNERRFEEVDKKYKELRTLILTLPKVEGKIEVYTFKNTNQVVVTYNRGIIIGTLYGLDHAKPVAALYEHRQGME